MEIRSASYVELLRDVQTRHRAFQQFGAWNDLLQFMANPLADEALKNELLRTALEAFKTSGDSRWSLILLAIFWPGLESLCLRRQSWSADSDEIWQVAVMAFLETLRRVDTTKRTQRLVQKIINDTAHHLYDQFSRGWRKAKNEVLTDWDTLQGLSADRLHYEPNRLHMMNAYDAATWRLWLHVTEGRISEDDYRLVVGTRIYGYSLSDFADAMGESYEALKKRRQRAESCIRKHELSD
jgi:DNA-directed RNA polymerase specialized sigma24 family protein